MMTNETDSGADSTRRDFLKCAAGISGIMVLAATDPVDGNANTECPATDEYDPHEHRYAFVMDIRKCIGCGSCVRACYAENNVPEHYFRTWMERYAVSREGHVEVDSPNGGHDGFEQMVTDRETSRSFFVPKLCNHCTQTPCVQLCPVGASYRSPDGLILVDDKRCIGCGYCIQACPYGSRFMHPVTHTASKCTLCYHRITKGLLPACVQACPTGTRQFGDLKKPGDKVAEIIATEAVQVLKPELRTEPNCYYLGLGREVR
jgi:tetrathionate reductase subunit B